MSADLRGHLEAVLRRSVPVIPLGAGPADPLSFRQTQFLASMRKIVSTLDGVKRIHLFGHSTGGLDAELFLRRQRVDREPWTADDNAIRHRIASVCTIAAPHYGTTLALTDLSRWLSHPVKEMSLAGAGLPAVSAFLATVPQHALSFSQALGGTGALLSFLKKFFQRRELLHDLMPARIEAERAENVLELSAPVSCFVTCPLPNPKPTLERFDIPDSLFLYLTNHTAGARVDRVSAEVMDNIARLNDPSTPVIASISGTARPPHDFDELDNDAVVNTARQLLPGAELAAIVYADHADVLGHYDRRDPAASD